MVYGQVIGTAGFLLPFFIKIIRCSTLVMLFNMCTVEYRGFVILFEAKYK